MVKSLVPKPGRLMVQVREVLRFHHYSLSTEKSYIHWILRYIRFNDPRSKFGKGYLKFLVDEIRIENGQAVMTGSHRALAEVVSLLNPESSALSVPASISDWRGKPQVSCHTGGTC